MFGNHANTAQIAPQQNQNYQLQLWTGNEAQLEVQQPSLNQFCNVSDEQLHSGQISDEIINEVSTRNFKNEDLINLAQALHSQNRIHQLVGVVGIRKILSSESISVVGITQNIIDMNLVPRLIEFLTYQNMICLQFNAAWALTNIASGNHEQAMVVCQNGAVDLFTHLLLSPNQDLKEQALWCLGNLAGDSHELRNLVLNAGALQIIVSMMEQAFQTGASIKNAAWVVSNLIRTKPTPPFHQMQCAVPVLFKIIIQVDDPEIIVECIWALSYVANSQGVDLAIFFEYKLIESLLKWMKSPNISIAVSAIRVIGSMMFASDSMNYQIIQAGVLDQFGILLSNLSSKVRREVAWAISNLTVRGPNILSSIENTPILEKLMEIVKVDELSVKKQAMWALANFNVNSQPDQLHRFLDKGALDTFMNGLKIDHEKIIILSLESIKAILAKIKGTPDDALVKIRLLEAGALDQLEQLQVHPNQQIYQLALGCLELFGECVDSVEEIEEGIKNMNL